MEKVDHRQIGRDLDAMFQDLASTMTVEDRRNALLEMLARVAYAETELLAAWERSKKPKQRTKGKKVEADKAAGKDGKPGAAGPVRREAETVTEGRDGNPRFVEALRSLWELRSKLLGLVQNRLDVTTGGQPLPPITAVEVIRPHVADTDGDHA